MGYSSPFAEFEYYLENFDLESFGERFFTVFAIVMLVFVGVFFLFFLASYILESVGLSAIAKRRGIKNFWLAWIPFARAWTIGAIADEQDRRIIGKDRYFRVVHLVGVVIYTLSILSTISGLAAVTDVMEGMFDASDDMILGSMLGFFATLYSGIMSINFIALLLSALKIVIFYKIYESVTERLPILFTLLSLFIPLFYPISIFCLRKKGYKFEEPAPAVPEAVEIDWYNQDI